MIFVWNEQIVENTVGKPRGNTGNRCFRKRGGASEMELCVRIGEDCVWTREMDGVEARGGSMYEQSCTIERAELNLSRGGLDNQSTD